MNEFMDSGREQAAEAKVEEKVEQWKKSPLYLASSSQYRLNALRELGFEDVRSIPAPEEVETEATERLTAGEFGKDYSNKFIPGLPAFIARAKIKHILENNEIPDDAMVCAVDTAPTIFKFKEKTSTDIREGWNTFEELGKPESEEDARKMMIHIFESVGVGFKRFLETRLPMIPQELSGRENADVLDTMTYGNVSNNIRINSGLAVRFPNEKDIEVFGTEINLQPIAVWAIVANLSKDHDTYETLADKVIAAMKATGTAPEKISGAIDYGNEEVGKILQLQEIFLPERAGDKEVFSGFSKEIFMNFVKGHAEDNI